MWPIIVNLKSCLTNFAPKRETVLRAKTVMLEDLKARWNLQQVNSYVISCCCLLDPRCKSLSFFMQKKQQQAWSHLNNEYSKLAQQAPTQVWLKLSKNCREPYVLLGTNRTSKEKTKIS